MFFSKLTQRWCNVLMPASGKGCEFGIAIKKLYQRYHYNINYTLSNVDWYNVVNLTLQYRHCKDVANLIL